MDSTSPNSAVLLVEPDNLAFSLNVVGLLLMLSPRPFLAPAICEVGINHLKSVLKVQPEHIECIDHCLFHLNPL